MNIVGTGLSGLVGSRVVELLSPKYSFTNLSLETGVDITNHKAVNLKVRDAQGHWVLHLAAYTNVQQAEKEREAAWKVNVEATEYIVDACKVSDKRLLYIDTDYAFDGTKKEYKEDDVPNPLGWYAKTKTEGAKRVLAYEKGLVIRISNPYRAKPVGKTDFVHKMLEKIRSGEELIAPTDQLFVPTFVDDIAAAIDTLISINATGIYHVVGSQALTPLNAAQTIARVYGLNTEVIKPTSFAEYFRNRAPTPQCAVLSNAKITALGVSMRRFEEGIAEVKHQEVY